MSHNNKEQLSDDILITVRQVFAQEEGRALLGILLDKTGMYTDPEDGESDQHFLGRRSVGIALLGLCNAADPNIYIKTLRGE
jgi:hypothetical protein